MLMAFSLGPSLALVVLCVRVTIWLRRSFYAQLLGTKALSLQSKAFCIWSLQEVNWRILYTKCILM